jgi:hypothetical protein
MRREKQLVVCTRVPTAGFAGFQKHFENSCTLTQRLVLSGARRCLLPMSASLPLRLLMSASLPLLLLLLLLRVLAAAAAAEARPLLAASPWPSGLASALLLLGPSSTSMLLLMSV